MTTIDPEVPAAASRSLTQGRGSLQWMALYVVVSAVVGAIASVIWVNVVDLPGYTVGADGKAYTSQLGLAKVFESDAWFVGIGIPLGLALGILAWRWFRHSGWIAPVLAAVGGLLAAVVCWQLGGLMGPGPFEQRLAAASEGDFVEISLELHALVALVVWVLTAELPVLFAALLLKDPDEETLPSADVAASVSGQPLTNTSNEPVTAAPPATAPATLPRIE